MEIVRPSIFAAPLLGLILLLQTASAQTVVNSTFVGQTSPYYSDPSNWAPAVVPNNTDSTSYNVGIQNYVIVDIDATVST